MLSKTLLLAASVAALASTATAQGLFSFDPAEGGFFISGHVGAAFPDDAEYKGSQNPDAGVPGTPGGPAILDVEFDNAVQFGGSVGYQLPFTYWTYFHPRLELEISHFEADVDGGSLNGGNQVFGGDQSTTSYLLTNYSDIVWSADQRIVPFIGGGIGFSNIDSDTVYTGNPAPGAPPTFAISGDDDAFTTTFGGGLTYRATNTFEIYAEARMTTLYDVGLERRFIANGADGFSANVEDNNIYNGALLLGSRIRF